MAITERAPAPRVLLGVTGGIAAYKAPELVRRLVERGCEVQVVMSRGAREFVASAHVPGSLGPARPRRSLGPGSRGGDGPHRARSVGRRRRRRSGHRPFSWRRWPAVSPATCWQRCASRRRRRSSLAPAMNQAMWANRGRAGQSSACSKSRGVRFLGPATGDQACGETGPGRMLEPHEIAAALLEQSGAPSACGRSQGLKVVITAGPTREPIDPVRYLTNRSSGKMGFAVAAAAREAGADVVLVTGPVSLPTPGACDASTSRRPSRCTRRFTTRSATRRLFIGCAAVSDYRPRDAVGQKIKRSAAELDLALVRSPDTLASIAALPKPPFTVGFAAETQDVARACAREARAQANRHDCRQPGRSRLRLRSRDQRAHGLLAGRRAGARRGLESPARATARRARRRTLSRGKARASRPKSSAPRAGYGAAHMAFA